MITIASREIGPHARPYVIAEMSGNHNHSLERALAIVDAAAASGADAVKLQTYTADTMTLDVGNSGFVIDDEKSLWAGRRLYDLYQQAHTPWEWHAPIMERAAKHGLHCFSSPFDDSAVDFLESEGFSRPRACCLIFRPDPPQPPQSSTKLPFNFSKVFAQIF